MSDSPYFRKLGDKLQRIPPNEPSPASHDESRVIAAAAQLGFVNRDPEPDIEVRQTLGPVVMMTMRVPVPVARQFKQFCKTNRFSYWEGIEELMKRAGG
ncbi:MAG: hypothetical protein NVSMB6_30140 [Burkholderiaceae bacterium]